MYMHYKFMNNKKKSWFWVKYLCLKKWTKKVEFWMFKDDKRLQDERKLKFRNFIDASL